MYLLTIFMSSIANCTSVFFWSYLAGRWPAQFFLLHHLIELQPFPHWLWNAFTIQNCILWYLHHSLIKQRKKPKNYIEKSGWIIDDADSRVTAGTFPWQSSNHFLKISHTSPSNLRNYQYVVNEIRFDRYEFGGLSFH